MEKEFIPYEQALALKELGFDEPCIAFYNGKFLDFKIWDDNGLEASQINVNMDIKQCVNAPTFSQAFRWLYQKLDIEKGVMPLDTESQQLLLKELIDKISSKHLLV